METYHPVRRPNRQLCIQAIGPKLRWRSWAGPWQQVFRTSQSRTDGKPGSNGIQSHLRVAVTARCMRGHNGRVSTIRWCADLVQRRRGLASLFLGGSGYPRPPLRTLACVLSTNRSSPRYSCLFRFDQMLSPPTPPSTRRSLASFASARVDGNLSRTASVRNQHGTVARPIFAR